MEKAIENNIGYSIMTEEEMRHIQGSGNENGNASDNFAAKILMEGAKNVKEKS